MDAEELRRLIAVAAEGRRVDFHALRTTTGTMLALLEVPRALAQRLMGHAKYQTTDEYYTRIDTKQRRTAAEVMPDLIAKTGTDDRPEMGRKMDSNRRENMMEHDEGSRTDRTALDDAEGDISSDLTSACDGIDCPDHSLPGWRNWQTRQTKDLVGVKSRGGSSPLPGIAKRRPRQFD